MTKKTVNRIEIKNQQWRELVGTDVYQGAPMELDVFMQLASAAENEDDAEAFQILKLREQYVQKHHKQALKARYVYACDYYRADYGEEQATIYLCTGCDEANCDFESCLEAVFYDAAEHLVDGKGIRHTQRFVAEGITALELGTLLVIGEGLTLKGFNTRVRRIYEQMNEGRTFTGWGVSYSWESMGPFDGVGYLGAHEEAAEATEVALNDLARELNAGKYHDYSSSM